MKKRTRRLRVWVEADLEDYLELHLASHLSSMGLDVLLIGRQTETTARGLIDLLAIDAAGTLYIIELKLGTARPEVTGQLLAYRRGIKKLCRKELIVVAARDPLRIDLSRAFQQHFGHPMPETVNESQVLVAIAASIHPQAVQSLLDLKDEGYSVEAFRYIVNSDELSLVQVDLDEPDLKPHAAKGPRGRRPRSTPAPQERLPRYRVSIDVAWFWLTHAHLFISTLVTFSSIYELYAPWARSQAAHGFEKPLQAGVFGRQLAALVAASGGWTRVYLPPGSRIDPCKPLADPPSMRARIDAGHRIVAYRRTAVDAARTPGDAPGLLS